MPEMAVALLPTANSNCCLLRKREYLVFRGGLERFQDWCIRWYG